MVNFGFIVQIKSTKLYFQTMRGWPELCNFLGSNIFQGYGQRPMSEANYPQA